MLPAGLDKRPQASGGVFTTWRVCVAATTGSTCEPLSTDLCYEAGVTAVHVHVRLLLVSGPLAVRRRWWSPVLGLGGGEGEVLPGVGLRGDGVGLGPRRGCLLLQNASEEESERCAACAWALIPAECRHVETVQDETCFIQHREQWEPLTLP